MADLTDLDLVRVLINDYRPDDSGRVVFTDTEITAFLGLESGNVKRAAAQAYDTIASNEALVLKVIKTQGGLTTDGAKVADALRKHAVSLREQADTDDSLSDDGSYIEVIAPAWPCSSVPELTEHPSVWPY